MCWTLVIAEREISVSVLPRLKEHCKSEEKECKTWSKEQSVVEYYFLAWHELTATAISHKRPVQDGAHQEGGSGRGIIRPQASLMSYWQLLSVRIRGYIFFSVVHTAKMSMFL